VTIRAVGLISGTSVDGLDAALIQLTGTGYDLTVTTLKTHTYPYPARLRERLLAVGEGESLSALEFGALHRDVGEVFGNAARDLIAGYRAEEIAVIGSHGQTVAHQPPTQQRGFSVQLGDGAVIQAVTGISTVSNFRARDLAWGGQGAPLVPLVDWVLFRHPEESRCIQNIGGIANLTYLPKGALLADVLAFDTGPGNMLLDRIVQLQGGGQTYDVGGLTACQGTIHPPLLAALLQDPYLRQSPPKSTGREAYGLTYLKDWLARFPLDTADLLATFGEFTCRSISDSYQTHLPSLPDTLWLCGGGVHNHYLWQRLQKLLPTVRVLSTQELGVDPDYKEAVAFAVLGYLRLVNLPGNLPAVTGARALVLGDLYTG